MVLTADPSRGKEVARVLTECFQTVGIFGGKNMPETTLPPNVVKGSLEHILFLTLTVSIDYMRDAESLWKSARESYSDDRTSYLFSPSKIASSPISKVEDDLQTHALSKKRVRDAKFWKTISETLHGKWNGDPTNLFLECDWDAPTILKRLKTEHHIIGNRVLADFPSLCGIKIGPLWLRMLRDNAGVSSFKDLKRIPIPVDIHIARSTLSCGVLRGSTSSNREELYSMIRSVWQECYKEGSGAAIDLDEALWRLSRYGCTHRDKVSGECPTIESCPVKEYCVKGKVDIANGNICYVDT